MEERAPLRVVVATGLHRAARRQAVEALLAAVPRSVAVHHGFEEVGEGVVRRSIRDRWGTHDERPIELVHACASCALREDLVPLLRRLAGQNAYELCVVEGWESVDPRAVSTAVAAEESLALAAVVTAVDTGRLVADLSGHDDLVDRGLDIAQDDDRTVAEVLTRQIEYPSALVVAGDRRPEDAVPLLEQLNPAAAVIPLGPGIADIARGAFDPDAAAARANPAWAQYTPCSGGRVATFTWTRTRPLHPERLHDALAEIVAGCLRGRGRIWLASRPDTLLVWDSHSDLLAIESAGPWLASLPEAAAELVPAARRLSARLDWDPAVGDRRQHLAFTGLDLDTERLTALLDSCLLAPGETWPAFQEDPFDQTLGTQ
ncbi:GTP-binding protein [Streptomonospora nanhaiensis]|uniref:GTP-binding protein n=1 Tax=Streptomonospora nanhaiensis TaxID=1323731 RepID=UPI001FE9FBCF|nr:GTP-binding protein [Streptomonospora nanhaiensis]